MKIYSFVDKLEKVLPRLLTIKRPLLLSKDEVIIHAPGFEDRTLAIKDLVSSSEKSKAILLNYKPYDIRNRFQEVRDALLNKGIENNEIDTIVYDRFDPNDFENRLKQNIERLKANKVIIDISSMSKLSIILVLNICREFNLKVRLLYTEAKTYGPTEEEFNNARLKKEIHQPSLKVYTGVHGVVRMDSLASVAMQGQPTAALVFMSLNEALTQVLLNTIYPSRLFLINGRPPLLHWREIATAWIHDQVRREWDLDNPTFMDTNSKMQLPKRVVSTLNYKETVILLLELYWSLSMNHRIVIAPAGSKMQAVGCYIVKALHPDIHIEYPTPEAFLPEYSTGIGRTWLLDLGLFSKTLDEISKIEHNEFVAL